MAADSLASLGRRTDARGECSGPAGTSLWAIGTREGAGPERGKGAEMVERNCDSARNPSAKRAEQIGPLAGA